MAFASQIAQIDQPLLQAGDLVAVVAIFQHPVLSRQEQLPGLLIQFAGDLQPVILLQTFKAIPGSFQKVAGNFSVDNTPARTGAAERS